jgi:ABC-2 type transport system ATP-binding protein
MLFLDEPSAGFDPHARLEIHELVLELRREQRTILLTTHYIESASCLLVDSRRDQVTVEATGDRLVRIAGEAEA